MAQITFADKETLNELPDIAEVNKLTAANVNEIKEAVNEIHSTNFVKKQTTDFVTLLPTDTIITINWDAAEIAAHGNEPFDIQLYEVATDGTMQKSTALLQVNQAKTIYSFHVGENSNLNFYYKII